MGIPALFARGMILKIIALATRLGLGASAIVFLLVALIKKINEKQK